MLRNTSHYEDADLATLFFAKDTSNILKARGLPTGARQIYRYVDNKRGQDTTRSTPPSFLWAYKYKCCCLPKSARLRPGKHIEIAGVSLQRASGQDTHVVVEVRQRPQSGLPELFLDELLPEKQEGDRLENHLTFECFNVGFDMR